MATLRSILAEPEEIEDAWGPWNIEPNTEHLLYSDGPWGIPLRTFRTITDLGFWASHVAGKGWATEMDLGWLVRAFAYLNPDHPQ